MPPAPWSLGFAFFLFFYISVLKRLLAQWFGDVHFQVIFPKNLVTFYSVIDTSAAQNHYFVCLGNNGTIQGHWAHKKEDLVFQA